MHPKFRPLHELPKPVTKRRNLPHWEIGGATYFLTFRLADSLPAGAVRELETICAAWLKHHGLQDRSELKQLSPLKRHEFRKVISEQEERWLNAKSGACVLRDPRFREPLLESLREFDGDRYCMDGFVIMPNHMHALVLPLPGWSLTEITSTWKKFSARKINGVSGLKGQLWLEETHDHIVRDVYELNVYRRYIGENPVKARLQEGEYELGSGIGILT